jgi:hypothetical protein
MRNHLLRRRLSVWTLCAALLGCEVEVTHRTWEPLDYQSVISDMLGPTGTLVSAEDPTVQTFLSEQLPKMVGVVLVLTDTLLSLSKIAQSAPPETVVDAGDWDMENGVPTDGDTYISGTGTSLYIEVGCPGPDAYTIGRTFEYGVIRIDSNDLADFSLKKMQGGTHLLFTIDKCVIPGAVLNASAAAYLIPIFKGMLLNVSPLAFGAGSVRGTDAYITPHGASILIDANQLGTYRLDITVDGEYVRVSMVASDGKLQCDFNAYGRTFYGCVVYP